MTFINVTTLILVVLRFFVLFISAFIALFSSLINPLFNWKIVCLIVGALTLIAIALEFFEKIISYGHKSFR